MKRPQKLGLLSLLAALCALAFALTQVSAQQEAARAGPRPKRRGHARIDSESARGDARSLHRGASR